MKENHRCSPFSDAKPSPPEIPEGVMDSFYAGCWIIALSSPKIWGALRRIPPKSFLLERIDAWLAFFGRSCGLSLAEDERAAHVEWRSAPLQRLRALLVDWEPPVVTPEIRAAALAVHVSEFSRPPEEDWGLPHRTGMPLEAMLLWPEGQWDEEAFIAGRIGDEPSSRG